MKGWPDYTRVTGLVENYDEFGQNYPVGIGDGAARLGSIKTYDMRGRVWWMDDFEAATLHWPQTTAGVGGAQRPVSDYVRNGEQALGLQANTGVIRHSRAQRHFSLPRNVAIGLELHISNQVNFGLFEAYIVLDDTVQATEASIRIDETLGQLQYLDEFNVYQDTGVNLGLTNVLDQFHALKIVFDYSTDEWIRIMWDQQEVNLNRATMRTFGTVGASYLFVRLNNEGDNVNNARMCFDDFIITTMEPD